MRDSDGSPAAKQLSLDERNHVEEPLLDQLAGLLWEIIDLDSKQHPSDSHRANFTEVVLLPVLRHQLKVINPWLETIKWRKSSSTSPPASPAPV
jgi:type I restriction enzyme R subunit